MLKLAAVLILLIGALVVMDRSFRKKEAAYRYVITETAMPSSIDPLDADSTRNLPMARMIYTTPVEVNPRGTLSSKVLESFVYDGEAKRMTWVVRDGLKFSDGSALTPDDVAFAVARMAHKRPKFPVVEDIEGVQEWASSENALRGLPSGISVRGNRIEISFRREQRHPLFRFGLEIFSIIPKRCVNLATGKIECAEVPGSGYYEISSKSESAIEFRKIGDTVIHDEPVPRTIRFEYIQSKSLLNSLEFLDDTTIVTGNELKLSPSALATLGEAMMVTFAPSSRIGILLLNPEVGIFKEKSCRRIFATAYRDAYTEYSKGTRPAEASIFTDVLPGYLSVEELAASSPLSAQEEESCRRRFAETGVPWPSIAEGEEDSFFGQVANLVFSSLKIPMSSVVPLQGKKDESAAFESGKVGFMAASTGFWAMDPAGDVQMLFTPNMHGILKFASADERLQKLIRNLEVPGDRSAAFENLNRYLHDEAIFNVFTHVRRFYGSPNRKLIAEGPLSITSPAPWQVFRMSQ